MSQSQSRPPPMNVAQAAETRVRADISATAQYLSFEPGLYAVDFAAAKSATTDVGLHLPCLRLEPIPPSGRQSGRAFISTLSEGGWIWRTDAPTFVLVLGGPAGVVLTIYKASDGMPAPQVRIRYIGTDGAAPNQASAARPTRPDQATAPMPASPEAPSAALQLSQLIHVRGRGDVKSTGAEWVGQPRGGAPIEGFAIAQPSELPPDSLEYQAVLGNNWNTPWFPAGEFCGSRGLALELLGFRLRLSDEAAARFDCQYWGSFVGKGEIGPIANGDVCEADGAPLEAIRVVILAKSAEMPMPVDTPAEEPAPELFAPSTAPSGNRAATRRRKPKI